MRVIRSREFTGDRPWAALDIDAMDKATVRLHWTDQPYIWHVNDGSEVFAVLDGKVDMHIRQGGREEVIPLAAGDVFHAEAGDEHRAVPNGAARILVVERAGSV